MKERKWLPDPYTRPDPDYLPEWAPDRPSSSKDEGEFSVGSDTDHPNAPLSPLAKMRLGDTGRRVG